MPANFSSMVGEFLISTIPKYCSTLAKNQYHNGHPDLLPKGNVRRRFASSMARKGSRSRHYSSGWQGHNPEEGWLMVIVFESNRPTDRAKKVPAIPFRFKSVYLGRLTLADWSFAGRGKKSRRTITASVTKSGFKKMTENWIYHHAE